MRIACKDFNPEPAKGFLTVSSYEPFENQVQGANRWIEEKSIDVINVESVLYRDGGQVLRVWFRD